MLRSVVERVLDRKCPGWRSHAVTDDKVKVACFWHDDKGPSLSVHLLTGYVHCFGCGVAGTLEELLAKNPGEGASASDFCIITDEMVQRAHEILDMRADARAFVQDVRGVSEATWRRFRLGLGGDRIWLPVMGTDGGWENVRRYKWTYGEHESADKEKGRIPKMLPFSKDVPKASKVGLFPRQVLRDTPIDQPILITEGEWDALVAITQGFPAITGTGGAQEWRKEWSRELQNRHVVLCYDCDGPGKIGMAAVEQKLLPFCESIRSVTLPLPGTKEQGKDVSDFFGPKFGYTADDLRELIDGAELRRAPARSLTVVGGDAPAPPKPPKTPKPPKEPKPPKPPKAPKKTATVEQESLPLVEPPHAEDVPPPPDDEDRPEGVEDGQDDDVVHEATWAVPEQEALVVAPPLDGVLEAPSEVVDEGGLQAEVVPHPPERRKKGKGANGSNGVNGANGAHPPGWVPSEQDPLASELLGMGSERMVGQWTSFTAMTIGKDGTPYQVPCAGSFSCGGGRPSLCKVCVIPQSGGHKVFSVHEADAAIYEMRWAATAKKEAILRKAVGIPPSCDLPTFTATEYLSFEAVRVMPTEDVGKMDVDDVSQASILRNLFTRTYDLEMNKQFKFVGRVMPDPKNQTASVFVTQVTPLEDPFENYEVNAEAVLRLSAFTPEGYVPGDPSSLTLKAIEKKFNEIALDMSANVTDIWGRDDVTIGFDLIAHSMLTFVFLGKHIPRGYVEGLIYGDSRCGKSETSRLLVQHYRAGEIVGAETVSVAGLLGGLEQIGHNDSQWTLKWGMFPRNDRKFVILDEIAGMKPEVIGALTGMRSSGIAELGKIESGRTSARVRALWMGNPRGELPMAAHSHDVEAIRRLIGQPADIARFDFAIPVREGEVPTEWINRINPPKTPHVYTSDLCHELITWAWSRGKGDVEFTKEAEQACLTHAMEMGRRYHASCPLVTTSEQRIKLARMAAACAARLFCTGQDPRVVLVSKPHVDYVVQFLDRIYDKGVGGYRFYSKQQFREEVIEGMHVVGKQVDRLPPGTVRKLSQASTFEAGYFRAVTGLPREQADDLLGILVQSNCLQQAFDSKYRKTPAFTRWLAERLAKEDSAGTTTEVVPVEGPATKAEEF